MQLKRGECRSVQLADDKFQNENEWVPNTGMYQRQRAEVTRLQEAVAAANTERMRVEASAWQKEQTLSSKSREFEQAATMARFQEVCLSPASRATYCCNFF